MAESFTPGEKWYPKGSPLLSSSTRFIPSGLPVEGYSGSVGFAISRSYSSKRNEQKSALRSINFLFKNNQFSLCLNPIASNNRYTDDCERFTPNNEFINLFVDVLNALDKTYIYDFKFSLFLHCNDSNKELLFFPVQTPYNNYLFSDQGVSAEEKMMRVMGYEILYKEFEFRGYFSYAEFNNLDLNSIKDFTKYA
ncbi:hypothetical protein OJ967_27875 (plasmid) [Peribacillus frigoritolerans]|uniref:hypothetical protein n=1 Tax=Peribacillus frigoritolerans TaxID=450367 RepID=UPI002227D479|nr:hypothetical protein [Peribacillus frigoritolerans]UYZ01852.1 hypothetical protein OJ967_27875 [Peribacillus frigoritolerans]